MKKNLFLIVLIYTILFFPPRLVADGYENSQAVKKAKSFLGLMAFSKNGLIDQLTYNGFTQEEAEYAVENCGADWSEQAVKKAKSFLDLMAFSKSGLIDQLIYNGFTHEEAEYAVENCGANWSEQAVKKAKGLLDLMAFSRSGLIDQLTFNGFTQEEAEYAVENCGGGWPTMIPTATYTAAPTKTAIPTPTKSVLDAEINNEDPSAITPLETEDGTIYFEYRIIKDNYLEITGSNIVDSDHFDGVIDIPQSIEGKSVKVIGAKSFSMMDNVISVTISDGITEIGDKAFALCENLETVTIPESIISISESAFSLCDNLTLVVKGDSYAARYAQDNNIPYIIEDDYFTDFLDYEIITDGTIRIIGFNTDDVPDNYSLIIPSQINGTKISSLGEKSFALNESISSVIIHEGITEINKKAFALCENLENVQIPSSVLSIASDAFSGCERLVLIVEPNSFAEEFAKNNGISYKYSDGNLPSELLEGNIEMSVEDELLSSTPVIIPTATASPTSTEIPTPTATITPKVTETPFWNISYYVDEFNLPTDHKYIYNEKDITGTFNNSATTKSKLEVVRVIDEQDIAIVLYQYGNSRVKNPYSKDNKNYKIIMLDSDKKRTTLSGTMYPGEDRIFVDSVYIGDVLNALKQNKTLSFYIEEIDHVATNYTFTILDNNGFSETYKLLTGEVDYSEKEESNSSIDDSKPSDTQTSTSVQSEPSESDNSNQSENDSEMIQCAFPEYAPKNVVIQTCIETDLSNAEEAILAGIVSILSDVDFNQETISFENYYIYSLNDDITKEELASMIENQYLQSDIGKGFNRVMPYPRLYELGDGYIGNIYEISDGNKYIQNIIYQDEDELAGIVIFYSSVGAVVYKNQV